ncbi:MAG: carbamoyl-phosphate synthase large subunit [Deltaproteobacteria bacterium]|nr:carbamoyl-phosphate synthase large subunit [Deltaproteobacteria bacterium]
MPKRTDIKTVLLIGSGPIVIGQACEFDYSGTQGAKALREEGYRVVLVNSNPATIMTDPELADRTYVEPLTVEIVTKIIERERPDALLPTLGGQTALNLAVALSKAGVLEKYGVKLIGAQLDAIEKAEDRELFKQAMFKIGLHVPRSGYARSLEEARKIQRQLAEETGEGFPVILRPSFTLGGSGAAIAWNAEEFDSKMLWGLQESPRGEVLVEQSVLGWKEYELEIMRDRNDNAVIICSIENLDPMGVHTGDSITIAPAMTLTDKEYQALRDASIAVIREIGVETGGSNIQFAVNPRTGDVIVIEMNPRVSRSSALASKATGYPIAKIAAKLAVGYTLDEITNDITRETPACFEPTIDYVVTKVPRFAFEKFPGADTTLGPQMKSVGEVMAMGRTFKESLGKALRSLEIGRWGFDYSKDNEPMPSLEELKRSISTPGPDRLWLLAEALRLGLSVDEAHQLTAIDPWFLTEMTEIVAAEESVRGKGAKFLDDRAALQSAKEVGLADRRLAKLTNTSEEDVRQARHRHNVLPVFKRVDTCAAEFEAHTPYLYSSYETGAVQADIGTLPENESLPTKKRKVAILGGGPNRIGQGIEFDYCCVHAVQALRAEGCETIMINCNPETVSTDYDTSDRLYFEPLTREDVLEILRVEQPEGVIVQFGGQTPLRLAVPLQQAGVKLLGTSADAIDRAEDRQRFGELVTKLGLKAPQWGTAHGLAEARVIAERIGYPVMVRPSYVLGGRAMEVVHDSGGLEHFVGRAMEASRRESLASGSGGDQNAPILVDQFLDDAIELDVDVVSDGHQAIIGGVMEHIEEAGIHSGDSACALPPYSLPADVIEIVKTQARALAMELGVRGLMNVQFAVPRDTKDVYILEVNPRASRTVPFVSKVTGVPLAKIAAKIAIGMTLEQMGVKEVTPKHVAVKEAVFPFVKFPGVDTLLGPEMRSTGEVMGIDTTFEMAFGKSQIAANTRLPFDRKGTVFISVHDRDKPSAVKVAQQLLAMEYSIVATNGTWEYLKQNGIAAERVNKVREGRPHAVDKMVDGAIHMVINTTQGAEAIRDSFEIRRTALVKGLPYYTTMSAARAAVGALAKLRDGGMTVCSLQEYQNNG